jgi:catechol 2,3-dioxygenase-like lactoylglutathione lyase family enzyme
MGRTSVLVDCAINVFCKDHNKLFEFYRDLLLAPEMVDHASPIYRGLQLPGLSLGFHDAKAYELLEVADLKPERPGAGHYPTFNLDSTQAVDEGLQRALALGAQLRKGPYETYYKAYQVVLQDPEGHLFRLNHYLPASL